MWCQGSFALLRCFVVVWVAYAFGYCDTIYLLLFLYVFRNVLAWLTFVTERGMEWKKQSISSQRNHFYGCNGDDDYSCIYDDDGDVVFMMMTMTMNPNCRKMNLLLLNNLWNTISSLIQFTSNEFTSFQPLWIYSTSNTQW